MADRIRGQAARLLNMRMPDKLKRRQHVLWLGGLYVAVLVGLVIFNAIAHAPSRGEPCPPTTATTVSPPGSDKQLATLSMREGQSTTIPFSRSLGLRERMLEFDATDPDRLLPASGDLAVSIGTFLRVTEDAELNHDLITATAHAQNRGVLVNICVNRSGEPRLGDPGTYTGVVSIVDPRVSRVDIPMTVSMSYNAWPLVLALLVLSIGPATVYLWLLRGSFTQGKLTPSADLDEGESSLSARQFGKWVLSRSGVMAIGAGVGAAFIAFSAGYLKNPAWGASITDLTGLFGAMFAGFVAAATAITAARMDQSE